MQRTEKHHTFFIVGCLLLLACLAIVLMVIVVVYGDGETAVVVTAEPTAVFPTSQPAATKTTTSSSPLAELATPLAKAQFVPPTRQPTRPPIPTLAVSPPTIVDQRPVSADALANLDALFLAEVPSHNYFEAVARLTELELTDRTVTKPFYQVGDRATFFVQDGSVEAELMAATDHAYFWVEVGLPIAPDEVFAAAERFEALYYPPVAYLFGTPWTPGVDNDPRFSVLHVNDVANSDELGYFTDLDEYPRVLYSNSNEQELVYLNMSQMDINTDIYFGTLVHELQHLIHWHVDANEMTWLNEGLAQLAELYVGLDTVVTEPYLQNSSVSLNRWSYDEPVIDAHYANAYLFAVYVWEQLGETAVQDLINQPANGLAAVRAILPTYSSKSWGEFLGDWAVATYLDDPRAGFAYGYQALTLERPLTIANVRQPEYETVQQLAPFGVHYIDLDYEGLTTVTFVGDSVVDLVDAPPPLGETMWFAADVNEVNAQLTAVFDLRDLEQATLTFDAWYDLEEDWDFAYLSISTDNGQSWTLLNPLHSVEGTYGPALNGRSADAPDANAGWVSETILLDDYIGQVVQLRFELLTDSTGLSRGFALANISIPEISDMDAGRWTAIGFVETGWQLPQQWQVQIIEHDTPPRITTIPLNHFNQGQWSVDLGAAGGTLVIMPVTPFVETEANYWLKVE